MIRTLTFISAAMAAIVCLGLYHLAEQARVTASDLRATEAAIRHEHEVLIVLGAEWARLTQPARIHALVQKHLDLVDRPAVELSSLALLPSKNATLAAPSTIRTAKAAKPAAGPRKPPVRTAELPPGA